MLSEYKDIILWGLSLLSTYLFFVLHKKNDKIKGIENQLSDKKYTLYYNVFTVFFNLIKLQKDLVSESQEKLVEKLIDIKKDMMIYAPDNIMNKFLEWNNYIGDNPGDLRHVDIFLELLISIRKDMGNSNTKLSKYDVLRSIMTSTEEFEKFKNQLSSRKY
ncbi:MAG: hypothetical protein Kow0027_22620 [Saprospiraceae bacterium]